MPIAHPVLRCLSMVVPKRTLEIGVAGQVALPTGSRGPLTLFSTLGRGPGGLARRGISFLNPPGRKSEIKRDLRPFWAYRWLGCCRVSNIDEYLDGVNGSSIARCRLRTAVVPRKSPPRKSPSCMRSVVADMEAAIIAGGMVDRTTVPPRIRMRQTLVAMSLVDEMR